jgi:hypothetical protein
MAKFEILRPLLMNIQVFLELDAVSNGNQVQA